MNCRRVAHDWTELKEGDLPFWRRVFGRMHLAICPACKAYARQMEATVGALGEAEEGLGEEESRAIAERVRRGRGK